MNIAVYPQSIREQVTKGVAILEEDPAASVFLWQELIAQNREGADACLLGNLYYYLGRAYYLQSLSAQSIQALDTAMHFLEGTEEYLTIGHCENLLGSLSTHQGNIAEAISYYSKALIAAERGGFYPFMLRVCGNISGLCLFLNRSKDALPYIEKGDALAEKLQILPDKAAESLAMDDREEMIMRHYALSVQHFYYLGMERRADQAMKNLLLFLFRQERFEAAPHVCLAKLLYMRMKKDAEREARCRAAALQSLYKVNLAKHFTESMILLHYLEEIGDRHHVHKVTAFLEQALEHTDYMEEKLRLSRFQAEYLLEQDKPDRFLDQMQTYRNLLKEQQVIQNRNIVSFLELRRTLRANLKNRKDLERKALTDELTGLYNRRYLNYMLDDFFERAYRERMSLGVEMLDVDHFKDVNDTFGHGVGDDCLCLVAGILHSLESDTIVCTRYGGDEFCILYLDYGNHEIERFCEVIRTDILSRSGQGGLPALSVSQGVCNRVPQSRDRLWDFSALADEALYEAKRGGRGRTQIVRSSRDVAS